MSRGTVLSRIIWSTPWPCMMMPRKFVQLAKACGGGAQTSATSLAAPASLSNSLISNAGSRAASDASHVAISLAFP